MLCPPATAGTETVLRLSTASPPEKAVRGSTLICGSTGMPQLAQLVGQSRGKGGANGPVAHVHVKTESSLVITHARLAP